MTLLASCKSLSWGIIEVVIIIQYEKPAGIHGQHGEDEAKEAEGKQELVSGALCRNLARAPHVFGHKEQIPFTVDMGDAGLHGVEL